jgi:peptidoglycan/xylan/chitin deacetylase (PgdA/CDA1 family)
MKRRIRINLKRMQDCSKLLRTYKFISVGILFLGIIISVCLIIYHGKKTKENIDNLSFSYYDPSAFLVPIDISPKSAESIPNKPVKLPIVLYHYVEYVADPGDTIRKSLDITPDKFDIQLKTIRDSGFDSYFVKDIPKILKNPNKYPNSQKIFLTFDDGYEDFYTSAYPILKKYNIKSTLYIVNNFINKKGYLNDKEIKEIISSGLVEIGAHTLDHSSLKKIQLNIAQREIKESKDKLEARYGIKIETLAYPYGAFDLQAIDIVKVAGFKAAVSVIPGVMQSNDNLFYLSRWRAGVFGGASIITKLDSMNK